MNNYQTSREQKQALARKQIKKLLVQGLTRQANEIFAHTDWKDQAQQRANVRLMWKLAFKAKLPKISKNWLGRQMSLVEWLNDRAGREDLDGMMGVIVHLGKNNPDLLAELSQKKPEHQRFYGLILLASLHLNQPIEGEPLSQMRTRLMRQRQNSAWGVGKVDLVELGVEAVKAENQEALQWGLQLAEKERGGSNYKKSAIAGKITPEEVAEQQKQTAELNFIFIQEVVWHIPPHKHSIGCLSTALRAVPLDAINWQTITQFVSMGSQAWSPAVLEAVKIKLTKETMERELPMVKTNDSSPQLSTPRL